MLHEKQSCIGCDIVDEIGLAQSTISEHLRILKAAGIITGSIERPPIATRSIPSAFEPLDKIRPNIASTAADANNTDDRCSMPLSNAISHLGAVRHIEASRADISRRYHADGSAEIAHVNLPVAVLIWLMMIPMLTRRTAPSAKCASTGEGLA